MKCIWKLDDIKMAFPNDYFPMEQNISKKFKILLSPNLLQLKLFSGQNKR